MTDGVRFDTLRVVFFLVKGVFCNSRSSLFKKSVINRYLQSLESDVLATWLDDVSILKCFQTETTAELNRRQ